MKIVISTSGLDAVARDLKEARGRLYERWERTAYRLGANAIEFLQRTYRTVRSDISTGVVTGRLRRSYQHDVQRESGNTIALRLGLIRPDERVLTYARVHEFGATYRRRHANRQYGGRPALAPTGAQLEPKLSEALQNDAVAVIDGKAA